MPYSCEILITKVSSLININIVVVDLICLWSRDVSLCIVLVCNQSVTRLIPNRSLSLPATEDDGERRSHQHCNDRRYGHQRDAQVKGRHSCGPEEAVVWIHCELSQHPLQSTAAEWLLLQETNQSQRNPGQPQVSPKSSAPSVPVCCSLSVILIYISIGYVKLWHTGQSTHSLDENVLNTFCIYSTVNCFKLIISNIISLIIFVVLIIYFNLCRVNLLQ